MTSADPDRSGHERTGGVRGAINDLLGLGDRRDRRDGPGQDPAVADDRAGYDAAGQRGAAGDERLGDATPGAVPGERPGEGHPGAGQAEAGAVPEGRRGSDDLFGTGDARDDELGRGTGQLSEADRGGIAGPRPGQPGAAPAAPGGIPAGSVPVGDAEQAGPRHELRDEAVDDPTLPGTTDRPEDHAGRQAGAGAAGATAAAGAAAAAHRTGDGPGAGQHGPDPRGVERREADRMDTDHGDRHAAATGTDTPVGGDPLSGHETKGDAVTSNAVTGDPVTGDPKAGDPVRRDATAADPVGRDATAGDAVGRDATTGDRDTLTGDPARAGTAADPTLAGRGTDPDAAHTGHAGTADPTHRGTDPAAAGHAAGAGVAGAGAAGAGTATAAPESAGSDEEGRERLIPQQRATEYASRWDQVKGEFVDEPRRAVAGADALVGDLLEELQDLFTKQRSSLDHGLDTDETSTEDLRLALRRYRSFFDRLLSI